MQCFRDDSLSVVNGTVHTMDRAAPTAEAVLVRGQRIVAVGSTNEIRSLAPPETIEIDAAGHTILPGFDDAHLHLIWFGLSLQRLCLTDINSLSEVVRSVEKAVQQAPDSAWVLGNSWNHNIWPEPAMPTRRDLDAVSGETPVALTSKDGHSLWCNTVALRLAGITQNTPDPAGGRIWRDSAGHPTGVLADEAMGLVETVIPEPTRAERLEAAQRACQAALTLGITSVQSCEGPEEFAALAQLEQEQRLPLRVWHMVRKQALGQALDLGLRSGYGSPRLRIGHLKLFADGALGSATAEMLAPYAGDSENLGVAVTGTEELLSLVRRAAEAGLASAIHAIGDAANRRVLDIYQTVYRELPHSQLRHRIEHVQLITPEDVARLARLNVVASMQPIHCTQDMDMVDRLWGERARDAYVFRDILNLGATLAFGTDCPVEALNPMHGLYAAITRRNASGHPLDGWHAEQRLSLNQALYAYTMGSAYASYQDDQKGSITPGKWADLVVLSNDIYANEPEVLFDTRVEATISDGRVAFAT